MSHAIARLFVLRRDQDVTGVSGCGDVADGVQWPDGSVVLRWRERPSTSVWASLELMLSVHGHDGATRVVWTPDSDSRARAAAGRAYQLADRWEAAHGSAHCLVRAAGAELRDVLDEDTGTGCDNTSHGPHAGFTCAEVDQSKPYWNVRWGQEHARRYAAAECSAQHHGFDDGPRHCIRATQHRGDHIDEHGFHWSDTVAVYPVTEGRPQCGQASVNSCSTPEHACKVCGDCMYEHPGEGGCSGFDVTELREKLRKAERARAVQRAEIAETELERMRDLLIAENKRANDAIDREDVLERALDEQRRETETVDRIRAGAQRDRDQHAAVLGEVLATFVHKVPGYRIPRVRSGEVDVVTLDKWRSVLAPIVERPWWQQVDTMRAELAEGQAALERVRAVAKDWEHKALPRSEAHRLLAEVRTALDGPEQPTTSQDRTDCQPDPEANCRLPHEMEA